MRSTLWILWLSLAGNAALGWFWWRQSGGREAAAGFAATKSAEQGRSLPDQENAAAASHVSSVSSVAALSQGISKLENLSAVQRELEAAGFPRAWVARILIYLAEEIQGRAMRELSARDGRAKGEYWGPPAGVTMFGSDEMLRRFAVLRETEATLASLLGESYLGEDEETLFILQQRYGPIPPDRLLKLQELERQYQEQTAGLNQADSATDREERRRRVQREHEDRLRALLSAHELQEYELRQSDAARQIRGDYSTAGLNEDEFRRLFALVRPAEELLMNGLMDRAQVQMKQQAQERLNQQLKIAFGEGRAADLIQASDRSARQENQLVTRLGLPLSAAAEISRIRSDMRSRGDQIVRDRALPAEEKTRQLQQLTRETEDRLAGTLGERGLAAYRDYGGQWLQRYVQDQPKP